VTPSRARDATAHPAELVLLSAIALAVIAPKNAGYQRRKPGEAVEEYLTPHGAKVASCGEEADVPAKTNLLVCAFHA